MLSQRRRGDPLSMEPAHAPARARQIVLAACDRHRLKRPSAQPDRPVPAGPARQDRAAGRPRSPQPEDRRSAWRHRRHRPQVARPPRRPRAGRADRPRPGRPPRFTAVQVAEVKALACQLPAEAGVPLSVWSCPELAREAVDAGVVDALSASTVRRWLAADAIKPWQHRSWIFPRDPDFRARASRILDLYAGVWEGRPLGP